MAESSRFEPVSSARKDELLEGAVPKSTKTATEFWLTVFSDFLQTDSKSCDWKNVTEGALAGLLEDFYCSAKNQDKSEYKRSSMIAARGAFQRHLNSLERGISLQGPVFNHPFANHLTSLLQPVPFQQFFRVRGQIGLMSLST